MAELKPGAQTLDSIFLTLTHQGDGHENHTATLGSVLTLSPCHSALLQLLLSLPLRNPMRWDTWVAQPLE